MNWRVAVLMVALPAVAAAQEQPAEIGGPAVGMAAPVFGAPQPIDGPFAGSLGLGDPFGDPTRPPASAPAGGRADGLGLPGGLDTNASATEIGKD